MDRTKKWFAVTAGVVTLGAGAFGATTVFAKGMPVNGANRTNLVNAIAAKFNLNATDVQAVFDAQHTQAEEVRLANLEAELKTRLTAAVQNGKLTQAQADAVTAKYAELKAFRATLARKTPAEVQVAFKIQRESLNQWAKTNNISLQQLGLNLGFGGPGKMMGHGGFGRRGGK